jgi:hypothetical protein
MNGSTKCFFWGAVYTSRNKYSSSCITCMLLCVHVGLPYMYSTILVLLL